MTTLFYNKNDRTQKAKHYQTDRQLKYLHLEAEINVLLQRLNTLKQRKQLLSELASK